MTDRLATLGECLQQLTPVHPVWPQAVAMVEALSALVTVKQAEGELRRMAGQLQRAFATFLSEYSSELAYHEWELLHLNDQAAARLASTLSLDEMEAQLSRAGMLLREHHATRMVVPQSRSQAQELWDRLAQLETDLAEVFASLSLFCVDSDADADADADADTDTDTDTDADAVADTDEGNLFTATWFYHPTSLTEAEGEEASVASRCQAALEQDPNDPDLILQRYWALLRLASLFLKALRPQKAEDYLQTAQDLAVSLPGAARDARQQYRVAEALAETAELWLRTGRVERAMDLYSQALTLLEPLQAEGRQPLLAYLAAQIAHGATLPAEDRIAIVLEAAERLRALNKEAPSSRSLYLEAAAIFLRIAEHHDAPDETAELNTRLRDLMNRLSRYEQVPGQALGRFEIVSLAHQAERETDRAEQLRVLTRAVERAEVLQQSDPSDTWFSYFEVHMRRMLSVQYQQSGDLLRAETEAREILRAANYATQIECSKSDSFWHMARAYLLLCDLRMDQMKWTEARSFIAYAVEWAERALVLDGKPDEFARFKEGVRQRQIIIAQAPPPGARRRIPGGRRGR